MFLAAVPGRLDQGLQSGPGVSLDLLTASRHDRGPSLAHFHPKLQHQRSAVYRETDKNVGAGNKRLTGMLPVWEP